MGNQQVKGSRQELLPAWVELAGPRTRFPLLEIVREHDIESGVGMENLIAAIARANLPCVTVATNGNVVTMAHAGCGDTLVSLTMQKDADTATLTGVGASADLVPTAAQMFSRTTGTPSPNREAVIVQLAGLVGASRQALSSQLAEIDTRHLSLWVHIHTAPSHEKILRTVARFVTSAVPAVVETTKVESPALPKSAGSTSLGRKAEEWANSVIDETVLSWPEGQKQEFGVMLVTGRLVKDKSFADHERLFAEAAMWRRLGVEPPYQTQRRRRR